MVRLCTTSVHKDSMRLKREKHVEFHLLFRKEAVCLGTLVRKVLWSIIGFRSSSQRAG